MKKEKKFKWIYGNRAIIARIDLPSKRTIIAITNYMIVGQGMSEGNKAIAEWITHKIRYIKIFAAKRMSAQTNLFRSPDGVGSRWQGTSMLMRRQRS